VRGAADTLKGTSFREEVTRVNVRRAFSTGNQDGTQQRNEKGKTKRRIHFIEQTKPPGMKLRPFNPATDMEGLINKAKSIGVALLILDLVVAAVPVSRN